jgi:DNA-binding GntR family transcriptional regulator
MHQHTTLDGMGVNDDRDLELRSLQQQIHDRLLHRILRRELEPGERIAPSAVAAAMGVSITPVRDAVNQMAAEGLVTVMPRRGTVVSPVSVRDIEELYEIRLILEPQAAAAAAERADRDDLERVQALADRIEAGPADGVSQVDDLEAYLQEISIDAELHAAIVRAAHNRRLSAMYDGLRTHVLIARTVFPRLYRSQPHRRGEHRRIVDAIVAHDAGAASEAMTAHLRQSLADILRHVGQATEPSVAAPTPPA